MENMLHDGSEWLAEMLKDHAGRSVTIRQGATTISNVVATATMVEHETMDTNGAMLKVVYYDWIVTAADLVAGGISELKKSNVIEEVVGGVKRTYEVMPVGKREPVESHDVSGIKLTIHTKLTNTCQMPSP